MRIVHCIFTMETGGSQILLVDIINTIHANTEVSLVVVNNEYDPSLMARINPGIPVYYIKRKRGSRNPAPLIKLNLLLLKIRPDVIHCHEANMVNFFLPGAFKTLLTIHTVAESKIGEKKYNKLVAISKTVAGDIATRYKLEIPVVMNGIPFAQFKRRSEYALEEGAVFRMIQVGRLVHEIKGQHILIEALHFLVNTAGVKNVLLDIVGSGPSENLLQKMAADYGLQQVVRFLGNKNRTWLLEHLSDYHLLVQPSLYEGFGLTVVEGIAAGLPVLASDIDGPREILSPFSQRFLFEKENVTDCVACIRGVKDWYSKGEVSAIVDDLYPAVESKYSITATAAGYTRTYAEMIDCN